VEALSEVAQVVDLLTLHAAPDEILVAIEVRFRDDLSTDEIEEAVDRIEEAIRGEVPEANRIFVEPEDREAAARARSAVS
jgi:divalent metal cation (Fe/Co/Zn/Cd) transporter